jgi:hypothetical protein
VNLGFSSQAVTSLGSRACDGRQTGVSRRHGFSVSNFVSQYEEFPDTNMGK